MDLENSINEVHRKVGENLLTIQKIELDLKRLIPFIQFSGTLDQFVEVIEEFKNRLSNKSLGQILSHYFDFLDPDIKVNEHSDTQGRRVHFSYEINFSKKQFEEIKTTFSNLLKERNELVHYFILDLEENSIDSCVNNIKKLDEQKVRLVNASKHINSINNILGQGYKELFSSLKKEHYYNTLRNEKTLLLELAQLSLQHHELNGWVSLGFAGKHIRKTMSKEVDKLKEKYGYKTLKPLLENTEIFEIKEDTNKNMVLYRLTDDWQQHLRQFYIESNV